MRFLLALLLFSATSQAQWTKVNVPTTASLRGLSVVSDKVIWASGAGGTVIRTTDAGKTWSVLQVQGAEQLDFRGIKALDEQNAVIISSGPAEKGEAQIYRTTDGGKTWQKVLEEKRAGFFFDAIAFWDRMHGIVLSDPVEGKFALFITEDGGASWTQLPPSALPAALPNEGAFAASNSCLVVQGGSNVWFATGGASVARVFRSHDRGKSWQVSETPMHPKNASSGVFSLAFQTAKSGVAVGGDYQHPESSDLPSVLFTEDGGATWHTGTPTNPAGMYLSSVSFLWHPGKDSIVAVGINGAMVSDGGSPWTKESNENLNSSATPGGRVEIMWAVGPKGIVLKRQRNGVGS